MSPPLRIVQVLPSLVVGGAERFATWLAEQQLADGHDVHLVCVSGEGPLRERLSPALDARTWVAGKRSRFDVTVLPRLIDHLRDLRPDVVHTHLFTGLAWGAVAARAARVPAVVHTQHEVHDDDQAYVGWARRGLAPLLDRIVGCSAATLATIRRRGFDLGTRSEAVDNGLPLAGRPRAVIGDPPLRVVAVGRLVPIKGHVYLLDAVAEARARGVDLQLTILGDGDLREEIEVHATRLGIAVDLPGAVADVAERLARADVFVQPSLSEAMPMALLEAAAAGLPMIVTDVGGAPTLLRAGAGGAVVPAGSARALADALVAHARQPRDARRALGDASRRVVEARYDLAVTARAYEAIYRAALAERNAAR